MPVKKKIRPLHQETGPRIFIVPPVSVLPRDTIALLINGLSGLSSSSWLSCYLKDVPEVPSLGCHLNVRCQDVTSAVPLFKTSLKLPPLAVAVTWAVIIMLPQDVLEIASPGCHSNVWPPRYNDHPVV